MTQPLISLQDVSVICDGKTLLSDINLSLDECRIVSIIGPNGGGKSTLVKTMLGLMPPAQGRIIRKPTLNMGYVPQDFAVAASFPLRVCDFLQLTLQQSQMMDNTKNLLSSWFGVRKHPRLDWHALQDNPHLNHHVARVLTQCDVFPLLDHAMQHLSGGERQRVLLANALLVQPDVVILDEPVQGLDPDTEVTLYNLISALPSMYGCSAVVVSHDLHWVMQGTHHVICVNQHICCEGTPTAIQDDATFQSLYTPQLLRHTNMHHAGQARYTHHHHCKHQPDGNTCDPTQGTNEWI